MKKFSSVPSGWLLPLFFFLSALTMSGFAFRFRYDKFWIIIFFLLYAMACVCMMLHMLPRTAASIEIYADHIICKIPLHRPIELEYALCNVGMDYQQQGNGKRWWIYLCYGEFPLYPSKFKGDRINSIKCQQGFIRIMYRDDVYDALMTVLPKKQYNMLKSAKNAAKL